MTPGNRIARALAALAAGAALAAAAAPAAATTPARTGPPGSMVSLGDSIMRGFNACPFSDTYADCPEGSFATGTLASVNSHYLRIRATHPSINGRNWNDAVTGARVSSLNGQAQAAVGRDADYVMVLIGANDACTATEGDMTSVDNYRSRFQAAMNTLTTGLPDARIYVVSIPDIYKLWDIGRSDFIMRTTWNIGDICQSLLASPTSTAAADVNRRNRVRQRVADYNAEMKQICAKVLRCKWDNNAAYNASFTRDEVSNLDAFHPNEDGQKKAAAVTWPAGPNFADVTPPTTSFSPDRPPDGAGGWYDGPVDVAIGATDPNSSVNGHEYIRRPAGPLSFSRYDGDPVALSGQGDHEIEARSVDVNGNVGASKLQQVTIDSTDPVIELAIPPADGGAGRHRSAPVVLHADADDTRALHDLACTVDGQPVSLENAGSSPSAREGDVSVSDDGDHTVSCTTEDRAGNTATQTRSFTLDTSPPDTTIGSGPSGPTSDTTPSFGFSATEPSDATFRCAVDGEDLGDCSSPFEMPVQEEGEHTFSVVASDAAGNPDPSAATSTFTVDSTEPEGTIGSVPADPTRISAATVEFSSNETGGSFECVLDGERLATCASPQSLGDLPDGAHTFELTAIDAAGNRDPVPGTATWTVDTDPPAAAISAGPDGPTSDTTPAWEFGSDEDGSTFRCRIDGGDFAACASGQALPVADDGDHTFQVIAVDRAGNAGPAGSRTFRLDTAAPPTNLRGGGPAGATRDTGGTFEFESDEAGSSFECRLDDGDWDDCASPHPVADLDDGAHTFEVRAVDLAGHRDPSPAERTWSVDTRAPATRIDAAPSGRVASPSARVEFSADEDGVTHECQVDGAAWQPACTSPLDLSSLPDGSHSIALRATDGAGNTDATPVDRAWIVDTTAPMTTLESGPPGVTSERAAEFDFSANEAGAFECRLDGAGWAPCAPPAEYRDLADGTHIFEVRSTDAAGNPEATPERHEWSVVTPAPRASGDTPGPTPQPGPAAPAGDPAPPACRFGMAVTQECALPRLSVGLSLPRRGSAADVKIAADSGGADLRRVVLRLPRGMARNFRAATPGSVGNLQLRGGGGAKVLRNAKLRLRKRARSAVLLTARGERVVLRYGASPRVEVTGLPAGVTRVQLTLKGNPLGFAPAATCKPTTWSAEMTDHAAGRAVTRGIAPVACRSRRPRGG